MQQLQPHPQQHQVSLPPVKQLQDYLEMHSGSIARAIPETMRQVLTPQRVAKVALMAAAKSGSLLPQCKPLSILKSLMDLASVGLEPGTGPTALAYLVPFRNRGEWEAQPVIGYRGYLALARRSGEFLDVHANVVFRKDDFAVTLGSSPGVLHKPFMEGDRGDVVAAYCVARFKGGGEQIAFMTRSDIERIRDKFSKAGQSGPWRENFEAMATKSVIRKAAKHWPLSTELHAAVSMDAGVVTPGGMVIDGDYAEDVQTTEGQPEAAALPPPATDLQEAQARAKALLG